MPHVVLLYNINKDEDADFQETAEVTFFFF